MSIGMGGMYSCLSQPTLPKNKIPFVSDQVILVATECWYYYLSIFPERYG